MTATRIGLRIALWAMVAATAVSQDNRQPPSRDGAEYPPAGFWPTEKMMSAIIDRLTEQMAKEYGFDDAQLWNTRDLLTDRFPRWFQDNRAVLQALTNQYIEAVIGSEPPTPEEVADWSQRAKPLFNEFFMLVEDTVDDMGTYLTDEQRIVVEGQMAAFRVGTNYMNQRLEVWSKGGYDWLSEWPRSDEFRRREAERRQRLEREATLARNEVLGIPTETEGPIAPDATVVGPAGPSDPAAKAARPDKAAALDEWAQYVEDFIRRFQLDEGQRNLAHRYLRDQTTLRDRYLRSRIARINAVETKLKSAASDEEKVKVAAELDQLNAPIERMFQLLKERLDRLPTRKQRAAAEATGTSTAGDGGASLREQMEARAKAAKGTGPDGGATRQAGDERVVNPGGR